MKGYEYSYGPGGEAQLQYGCEKANHKYVPVHILEGKDSVTGTYHGMNKIWSRKKRAKLPLAAVNK